MSTRLYDYIVTLDNASQFVEGNNLIGLSSGTYGIIANVDTSTNNIKVKVNNVFQEYTSGESVVSNSSIRTNIFYTQSNTVTSIIIDNVTSSSEAYGLTANVNPASNSEITVFVDGYVATRAAWVVTNSNLYFKGSTIPSVGSNLTIVRSTGNVNVQHFVASYLSLGNTQSTITSNVTAITNSPFIRAQNSFEQAPLVRLLTIYYPGEWYPPNEAGNPTGSGAGYDWPANMPWKIAEIIGDTFSDLLYNVTFGSESFIPYPLEADGISASADGSINSVTLKVANFDNIVTNFVENPFLVGNVTSNSATGYVNGELVNGLDPATVTGNAYYDQTTVDGYYGKTNAAWSYTRASLTGETWLPLKYDTRDMLGAVVEIKSTFASYLKFWPEHSSTVTNYANTITVINTGPYRIGDKIVSDSRSTGNLYANSSTIVAMEDSDLLILDNALPEVSVGDNIFIINDAYDQDAYVKDVFKITEMPTLNEHSAEFTLTSWLQYFKLQLPKRKFYRRTCQWVYQGAECAYPGPGNLTIPDTFPSLTSNADSITINNEVGITAADDVCAKSFQACQLRNNTIHFGGFPASGRPLPK